MNSELTREFMRLLTVLRTGDYRDPSGHGIRFGRCVGFTSGLFIAGIITFDQWIQLDRLTLNASLHAGKPLPSPLNAGPVMPALVRQERQFQAVKPSAQVPADERPSEVPAPASRSELRLFCLLVKGRDGALRSLPVHTMRPMPPRVTPTGRWSLASDPAFHLRETRAERPSPEVLARYSRQRQANAVRAHSRAV